MIVWYNLLGLKSHCNQWVDEFNFVDNNYNLYNGISISQNSRGINFIRLYKIFELSSFYEKKFYLKSFLNVYTIVFLLLQLNNKVIQNK